MAERAGPVGRDVGIGARAVRAAAAIAVAAAVSAASATAATAAELPEARVTEPRAFGWRVGDVVTRRIALTVPGGFALDETSLPQPGGRGQALELRSVQMSGRGAARELRLDYQVFLAPREVRTLEMPAFALAFTAPTDALRAPQSVRIDAWPVVVAPLVPVDAPTRTGLGELRPDIEPPLVDTGAVRTRLWLWAAGLALVAGFLAQVYLFVPWWARRHRPFGIAWQRVNRLQRPAAPARPPDVGVQRQAAYRQVHDAINRSAGGVLFEAGLDRWLAAQPRFAPLRDELREFFRRSRGAFFAAPAVGGSGTPHDVRGDGAPAADAELAWLLQFTRRCRDVERGSA
jgi:mxaA protein